MWIQNVFELVESQEVVGKDATPLWTKGAAESSPPDLVPAIARTPPRAFAVSPQALGHRLASRTTWSAVGASPASWASLPLGKAGASRSPSTAEATAPLLTVLTVNTEPLFSSLLPAEGSFLPLDLGGS